VGALVVMLYLGFLLSRLYRYAGGPHLKRLANIILSLLVLQVALGMSNILWSLPLAVAVAHNAVGALLLLSLVSLNYRLYKGSTW
jgi:cytochrome c oxidase assembly protein subunit 15